MWSGWPHLSGGAQLLNAGWGVDEEGKEAQHNVDDDCVDVGAQEGGLEPSSHRVQDDSDGDQEGSLHTDQPTRHQSACTRLISVPIACCIVALFWEAANALFYSTTC